MSPPQVIVPDSDEYARGAAEQIAEQARAAIRARGSFSIVLAGGSTPKAAYERLAASDASDVRWERWEVFFGDERCVPPDHAESNYRMAREALLSRVPIPENHVHRMRGEIAPHAAADEYDAMLRGRLGPIDSLEPTFDLVLLGVGEDGHTASLFPGSPTLDVRDRYAVATVAPEYMKTRERVTLTYPALTRARLQLVLATGAGKRPVVTSILRARIGSPSYPAGGLVGMYPVRWLLDREAAEDLARAEGLLDDAER